MRIALVTHRVGFQDGQGRVNYEITKAALAVGHQVTIVAESCDQEIVEHPSVTFVRLQIRALPTRMLKDQYFAMRGSAWLRRHRHHSDIVQADGFVTWEPADILAIHYVHGAWLNNSYYPFHWSSFSPYHWYQRLFSEMNARFERHSFTSAKILVAVSQATASEVVCLGFPADKVRVIYNGVDTDEFQPPSAATPADRTAFGLPTGVPLALFAGDIRTPRKNLETVLQALTLLPGVHLAVAGAVESSPYPEQARQMGLADRVHFVGKTERVPALMRSCDLFVMPSRYETFGMVVLEAMAAGLPVVLSSKVGAVEFVADVSRVVDDPDDVDSLATEMRELFADDAARALLAEAGRRRALELQWSRTVAGYLALYEEFAAAHLSPAAR